MAPHTEISPKGGIVYSEIERGNVRKLEAYVKGPSCRQRF
jgi:hypothetical protein